MPRVCRPSPGRWLSASWMVRTTGFSEGRTRPAARRRGADPARRRSPGLQALQWCGRPAGGERCLAPAGLLAADGGEHEHRAGRRPGQQRGEQGGTDPVGRGADVRAKDDAADDGDVKRRWTVQSTIPDRSRTCGVHRRPGLPAAEGQRQGMPVTTRTGRDRARCPRCRETRPRATRAPLLAYPPSVEAIAPSVFRPGKSYSSNTTPRLSIFLESPGNKSFGQPSSTERTAPPVGGGWLMDLLVHVDSALGGVTALSPARPGCGWWPERREKRPFRDR